MEFKKGIFQNWKVMELIKFDVSVTSYYVELETGALLCDVAQSWKMILEGHGKS